VQAVLLKKFSTDLINIKGPQYFVNLLKVNDKWDGIIPYLSKVARYDNGRDQLAKTDLLSYLVRNMDKAVGNEEAYSKLVLRLSTQDRSVTRMLQDSHIDEIVKSINEHRSKKKLDLLASIVICSLCLSPAFQHEIQGIKQPAFTFDYNAKKIMTVLDGDEEESFPYLLPVVDMLRAISKSSKGTHSEFAPQSWQHYTKSIPFFHYLVTGVYVTTAWGLHFSRKLPATLPLHSSLLPFSCLCALSLAGIWSSDFLQKWYSKRKDEILDPGYGKSPDQKHIELSTLRAARIVQRIAFAYFFPHSFLPTFVRVDYQQPHCAWIFE